MKSVIRCVMYCYTAGCRNRQWLIAVLVLILYQYSVWNTNHFIVFSFKETALNFLLHFSSLFVRIILNMMLRILCTTLREPLCLDTQWDYTIWQLTSHFFQTISCDSKQCSPCCYLTLPYVDVSMLHFSVLQLVLGFLLPYLKEGSGSGFLRPEDTHCT